MVYYNTKYIIKDDYKMLFTDLSQKWLDLVSQENYCYQYKKNIKSAVNYLNNEFGLLKLDSIKSENIKGYISDISICNPKTKKKSSRKLLSDIVNIGNRIMEFGIDNDYCEKNPFRNKKDLIPHKAIKNQRYSLSERQQNLVINTEHKAKMISMIMMFCGLRLGEVLALTWDDIDLSSNKVAITKTAEQVGNNEYSVTPHTKNGKDRYVSIPNILHDYLFVEREKRKILTTDLICYKGDRKLHTPSSYYNMWKSYQTELNYNAYCLECRKMNIISKNKFDPSGIPVVVPRFTAHQLRHTYCTMLYLSGVDVLTCSHLMGHSSVDITLKIYTHLDEKYKSYNIDKYNEYVNRNFQSSIYKPTA